MNLVHVNEISEVSTNKPLYWEVEEDIYTSQSGYFSPFYIKTKNKDDAMLLKEIINRNVSNDKNLITKSVRL